MIIPDAVKTLLEEVVTDPSFARYQSVGRALAKFDWSTAAIASGQQVRLALESSFTLDHLIPYLRIGCLQAGLVPTFQTGEFNQYRQAILQPDSALYAFQPDLLFLLLELESLLPAIGFQPLTQADIDHVLHQLTLLAEAYAHGSAGLLVIGDFIASQHFPYALHAPQAAEQSYAQLNLALAKHFQDNQRVLVAGLSRLANYHGVSRVSNPKLRLLASMAWGETFLPQVSRLLLAYIKAAQGKTRKCLVLDLDNTLWGGVIGEDGLAGIQLGPEGMGKAFYAFQASVLALYQQGVILAINSKNNYADAIEAIRQHPHMLLREACFGSLQINWDDKATNLLRIAEELNIGLDSLVFVDDSPPERLLIRQTLPEVLVVDLPADPVHYAAALEALNDFAQLYVTDEDRERGKMYAAQRARHALEIQSASLDDYLDSLKMKLILRPIQPAEVDRVHQLIQRTNQFNLTTRRYTRAEIERMMAAPDYELLTLRASDIFGDYGLTGTLIVKKKPPQWEIDSYLLSCRIMGRTIELEVLNQLVLDAQAAGVSSIIGDYIPTSKNKPVAGLYNAYGFRPKDSKADMTRWELPVGDFKVAPLSRFEVQR